MPAEFCVTKGDFERAARHYLRAMEIQPDDYQSPIFVTSVFQSLGRPEEAAKYARLGVKRAEEALRLHPESSKPAQQGACALAILGERERAKEWLARALAIDPDDNLARYNAACTYSLLGEIDRSIDLLEVCLQQFGSDMKLWFKYDSDLDPIRNHPRYQNLLKLTEWRLPGANCAIQGPFPLGRPSTLDWRDRAFRTALFRMVEMIVHSRC